MLTTRSRMISIFFIESSCATAEISNSLVFAKEIKRWLNGRSAVGGSRVHSQDVTDRIEFQLPDGEHHTRGEVRGGLTVSLPPPGVPPAYPEVGAGYEEEAVVMIAECQQGVAQ